MQTATAKHLFNLSDYYRMADSGVFADDSHLELINGEIIDMAPIGSKHAGVVSFLARQLTLQLGEQAIVRSQDPIHLGDLSAPQPDIAIVKASDDFYLQQHPTAQDVLLLIEVADSSVQYDLKTKIPLYAQHGIAECWLIDLTSNRISQFFEPNSQGYAQRMDYQAQDWVTARQLPTIRFQLAALIR